MELSAFIEQFPPGAVEAAGAETVERYQGVLPAGLIELWRTHGLGKYGGGLIEVVNPDDFQPTLQTWLGKKVDAYVPIALGAFGDLFYYRRLSDAGDEDVCTIDPHFRDISDCAWSLADFFNEYLSDDETLDFVLRRSLFGPARAALGPLARNEIYLFKAPLVAGGAENLDNLAKGNAQVQLDLLFQWGK